MLADYHEQFIAALYHDVGSRQRLVARVFVFRGRLMAAAIFPTDIRDEAGRPGLSLAVGFQTFPQAMAHPSAAAYFFRYLQVLNRLWSVQLPEDGAAADLVAWCQVAENLSELSARAATLAETMLFMSEAITELIEVPDGTVRRWMAYAQVRRRMPRALLVSSAATRTVLLRVLFAELRERLSLGTAVDTGPDGAANEDVMSLMTIPGLDVANSATLRKRHGYKYIAVY